ncbi:MAG: LiaI-LiaF-like domain-containing protein [Candidatus Acidiferrales bacterium]
MADEIKPHCTCANCRIRGLMGPVMLITVGALFLIRQYSRFGIGDLWPILLIVAGIVLVAQAMASRQGHVGS